MKAINKMKLLYFIPILLLALMLSSKSQAQETPVIGYKVIRLKDGSKLKGRIVARKADESITLRLFSGQEITLMNSDIKLINNYQDSYDDEASKKTKSDKVYFKNGGKLYGEVKDYVSGDFLLFELSNGQEVTFGDDEIAKIRYNKNGKRGYQQKQEGYFIEIDLGMNLGQESDFFGLDGGLLLHTVLGHRFNPNLQTGLGVGVP